MELKVGFSTGAFHKEFSTKESLSFLKGLDVKVVELGFVKMERITQGWVDELSKEDLEGFDYISIHAPVIQYGKNSETELVFSKLKKINELRKLDLMVFHPDTVEDFSVFDNLNFSIGFENMDNRKLSYKTIEEMKTLLETNPSYGMVLDVNHIYTNDKTMVIAKEFFKNCGSRIKEIHLSGYETLHDPLFKTRQSEIIESIEDFSIPIINEADTKPEDVEKERDYVTTEIKKILSARKL